MLGIDPETGRLVEGGIRAETRQALELIKAAVERNGSSMDRVAKCTVFLAEMDEWAAMNEVYVQFFPGGKPARSAVEVDGLALDARLEIECIAVLEEPARPGGRQGD
jgi:reactive intermediate/imine deaminase